MAIGVTPPEMSPEQLQQRASVIAIQELVNRQLGLTAGPKRHYVLNALVKLHSNVPELKEISSLQNFAKTQGADKLEALSHQLNFKGTKPANRMKIVNDLTNSNPMEV